MVKCTNPKSLFFSFLSVLIFVSSIFVSCSNSEYEKILLMDNLYVSTDEVTYEAISAEETKNLAELLPDREGLVWLKTYFTVPDSLRYDDLAFYAGRPQLADKVFINGQAIGRGGNLPPNGFSAGLGFRAYDIPKPLLDLDGPNSLKMCIWVSGNGGLDTDIFIAEEERTHYRADVQNFFYTKLTMVYSFVMGIIFIFYFCLYLREKDNKSYLFFALMNLSSAFFLISFYPGELPGMTNGFISYLTFFKIFFITGGLLTSFFVNSFILHYLDYKRINQSFTTRLIVLLVPAFLCFCIPSYSIITKLLPLIIGFILCQLIYAVIQIFNMVFFTRNDNNGKVRTLFGCFYAVYVGLACDLVVHVILKRNEWPVMTLIGWQGTLITFLVILTREYNKISGELKKLSRNLQLEIDEKTKLITEKSKNLQKEQDKISREMGFAAHVQQAFYPHFVNDFKGWDISVYFRPLEFVSGDMYNFYAEKNKLDGFGLFDVSGHGLAAGLVTMLTQNMIAQHFKDGNLPDANGNKKPLPQIMEEISDHVIKEKGQVENYLVGTLCRFEQKSPKVEMVNAGSPPLILYSSATKSVRELLPSDETTQFGMIGVEGFSVSFSLTEFEMSENDVVVAYTDGLNEAINPLNEQFGRQRIAEILQENGDNSTAQQIKEAIMAKFEAFREKVPLADDITLIVMKRTAL